MTWQKKNVCFLTLRFWAARIGIETLKQDKPKTEPGKYSLPIDPSAVQLWRLWRISISVLSGWSSGPGTSNILLQWDVYTVCVYMYMYMYMYTYTYTYTYAYAYAYAYIYIIYIHIPGKSQSTIKWHAFLLVQLAYQKGSKGKGF